MPYKRPVRDDVFITSVWRKKITNFSALNETITKELKSKDAESSHKNIYGGQEVRVKAGPGIRLLLDCAESLAKEVSDFLHVAGGENPRVTCFWGNINNEKEFNPPHIHPGSDLSGAYYVEIPENEITNDDQFSEIIKMWRSHGGSRDLKPKSKQKFRNNNSFIFWHLLSPVQIYRLTTIVYLLIVERKIQSHHQLHNVHESQLVSFFVLRMLSLVVFVKLILHIELFFLMNKIIM